MQNLSFNYGFIDKIPAACYNGSVITTSTRRDVKGEKAMFDRLIASIVTADFFRKAVGRDRTHERVPKRRAQETIPDITVLAAICREGISVE